MSAACRRLRQGAPDSKDKLARAREQRGGCWGRHPEFRQKADVCPSLKDSVDEDISHTQRIQGEVAQVPQYRWGTRLLAPGSPSEDATGEIVESDRLGHVETVETRAQDALERPIVGK